MDLAALVGFPAPLAGLVQQLYTLHTGNPSGSAIQIAGVTSLSHPRRQTAADGDGGEEQFEYLASKIPETTGFIGLGAMGQGMSKGE